MEEGKGPGEGPPLFSHRPSPTSHAAAASDSVGASSSSRRGAFVTGGIGGIDLRRSFNEKIRGAFGVVFVLNLFLGGFMLFQGKRLRRVEEDDEEGEERNRKQSHKHKGAHKDSHSKEGGHREGYRERERAGEGQRGDGAQQREREGKEGQAVEESHIAEKLLWARDDLDEYLDRCLALDAGLLPQRPAKAVTYNEQMAVLQWILEEKRREHPATRLEKRRVDADKRMLKDLMRSGKRLPLRDL